MQQQSLQVPPGVWSGGRSDSLGLLASCLQTTASWLRKRWRWVGGKYGRSSAARLSRKRGPSQGGEHAQAKASAAPSAETRGGLRSAHESPLFLEIVKEGSPGAHVLAVVPAHRGTYAEVRGRCWLQISSRHALQKQRSDESEREPRWVAVPGFSRGSGHRRSSATPRSGGQRPLRGGRPRVAS